MIRILIKLLPGPLMRLAARWRVRRARRRYAGSGPGEIFSKVYAAGTWSGGRDGYNSGAGSHEAASTEPYIAAVRGFLSDLPEPPDVADLGCGDFAIGAALRDLCARYLALDAVEDLVQRNRAVFSGQDVEFDVHDLTADPLPDAQVYFLRQVLQHLSNADIARVLERFSGRSGYLIVTEHVPFNRTGPNRDHDTGPLTRAPFGSWVDITAAPFRFSCQRAEILCIAPEPVIGGNLVTTLFEL